MSNVLPEAIKLKVLMMPEYSQGANKVRVTLRDGRKFSSVFIAWGSEIIKLGVSTDIPFDAEEIIDVESDL